MGAIALKGERTQCHRCGVESILDGHGRCVKCFDKEVDEWMPPIYAKPVKDAEWRARNKVWQSRYYRNHKTTIIPKQVAYNRRRRLEHPGLLLKERERELTAAWKKELQAEEAKARESLNQTQVYQAFNSIGRERLDRKQTEALLEELGASLDDLPTQSRNRKIFENKGQAKAVGSVGRQFVDDNLSWETIGQLMKSRLEEISVSRR